jgi:glycosyltransferase involved in cell wall biosynthesis
MPTPLVSLIIPARNEEAFLNPLLESVAVARAAFTYGPEAIEVIVVDNDSTDCTSEIGNDLGCLVVSCSERSIAAVRNAGAAAAQGEIVIWVDADSVVHPDLFNAVVTTLSENVIVGATGIRMSRSSVGIALTMLVVRALTKLASVGPGVVFCRRDDWEAVRGYDESRLYAEDVKFQTDLKRLGRPRGQGFAWAKNVPTISSARKYDRHGDWHALNLLWQWFRGPRAFKEFAESYWYGER